MSAIETQQLCKNYGDFEALIDLNLEVHEGEVFGFLGPNGAGKSTTIRTLLDEIRPTSGTASLLGLDTHKESLELRRRIGYLPSDLTLYPSMTGRQFLRFMANLHGSVDWNYVTELAERLDADLSKRTGELSTGNRQKIGIIMVFMQRPELLVMDEPNAGLDPLVQHEFIAMMREVTAEGRTVFLSSHTLSEVERVADRVGIIRSGRLAAVESVAALRNKMMRTIELVVAETPSPEVFAEVPGARDVEVHKRTVKLSFDGDMARLLATATKHYTLTDFRTQEADLEDIFLTYYQGQR